MSIFAIQGERKGNLGGKVAAITGGADYRFLLEILSLNRTIQISISRDAWLRTSILFGSDVSNNVYG
jgi:hypothetical protein